MKKRGLMLILLVLVFLVMVIGLPVMAEDKLVPITKLGVAPWLGKIQDEKDLLKKFEAEKPNFVKYIRHDLKKSIGLEITSAEAIKIVASMEKMMEDGKMEKISIPDGTVFKSMGWRSRKTGKIMRTANPVLKLGRKVEGFLVKIAFKNYDIEYVFLKDCGNLSLRDVKKEEIPPKAEYVPEAPLPKAEVPTLPQPKVEASPPQKCPEQTIKTYVYVYVSSPPAQTVPVGYIPPQPSPFVFREPIYYTQPSVSYSWSAGIASHPSHSHHAPSSVRPPHVRTVPPAIKPPTVRTVPPASSSHSNMISPPSVRTK